MSQPGRPSKRPRVRTQCPCCHKLFENHASHQGQAPACKAYVQAIEDSDDDMPGLCEVESDDDDVQEALNYAEAAEVAEGLATLKYERGFQRPDVDAAKAFAGVACERTSKLAYSHLQHLLRPEVDPADVAAGEAAPTRNANQAGTVVRTPIARIVPEASLSSTSPRNSTGSLTCASPLFAAVQAAGANVFKGVETAAKEKAYLKKTLPMLEPRVAELGEGHRVVSVNALDAIERLLREDSDVRKAVIAKSEEWKKGEKWQTTAEEYRDMDDGSVARHHAHLMRPAAPGEERDLRVGLLLYGDEVEV